ncbi:hypothetical protein JHK84_035169 [Glycine max]|uniref:Legume lectin domain-containing protein n=2 Tax=Glycine subgen. Soja TaxID=1462606 RepID=A0A0R0H9Q6_SOYBN|nr:hypothetical protein JHK87_034783 [Glycine soja]KAG4981593.1 hypothetical protein JHK85_035551 [Glycine max]KAG4987216.1 hypothetical protein JHK86_034907 [Glycine max]KAG5141401.1 hypothetical protein JHK84_035169 [Glycine max]KAH1144701.1 hypothetical protein GYH30_034766 [Glycine max]
MNGPTQTSTIPYRCTNHHNLYTFYLTLHDKISYVQNPFFLDLSQLQAKTFAESTTCSATISLSLKVQEVQHRKQTTELMLKIICCKSSVAFAMASEKEALIDWAYRCYSQGKEAKNDVKRVEKYVMVAIWCIQEDPSLRPSMKKATQMLEGVTTVSTPPHSSIFRSKSFMSQSFISKPLPNMHFNSFTSCKWLLAINHPYKTSSTYKPVSPIHFY